MTRTTAAARVLAGPVALLLGTITVIATGSPASAATATDTSYSYTSAAGDYIGQGRSAAYTPANATITVSGNAGSLTAAVSAGSEWWYVNLAAPVGSQLAPGAYLDAQRAAFRAPGHPGLDVYGDGRGCNTVSGDFTITSLSADATGRVTVLDASFTQHCETATAPPLTGVIRYQAPQGPNVLVSSNPSTIEGQPVTLTATVPGATGSVSFLDGSTSVGTAPLDARGQASLRTSALAAGAHSLRAAYGGDPTHPASTSDPVAQSVGSRVTSYWFTSPAGDYIGAGATASYTPSSGAIAVTGTTASLTASVSAGNEWWYITLAAPPGQTLAPGTYTGAERAAFRSAGHPGLDVSGDGRGCNNVYGSFTIAALKADAAGNITSLDATFAQQCESTTAQTLTGAIRVNALASSTTTLTASTATVKGNKPVTFTATVAGGPSVPIGTVTFATATKTLCASTTLVNGKASCTTTALPARSTQTVTATYSGDATHAGSTSNVVTVTVK